MPNEIQSVTLGTTHVLLSLPLWRIVILLAVLLPLLMQLGCEDSFGQQEPKAMSVLQKKIDQEIIKYEESSGAFCGVYIVDLRTGQPVTELRTDDLFKPGSNMKLLTTAFALKELGPDFEFTTSVYRLGDDIVVVGDGDPGLGAHDLEDQPDKAVYEEIDLWANAIKEKISNKFAGDLVMCSEFDLTGSRPGNWSPAIYRFSWAPATGGLNFHDNLLKVDITIANGKVDAQIRPQSRFFKVVNKLELGETENVILKANSDDSQLELTGTVTAESTDKPIYVPINEPELFTGRVLAERLLLNGVRFDGKIRYIKSKDIDLSSAELLYRKKTPLAISLKRMNIRSLNMPAGCHFLRAGDGTWQGTVDKLMESLRENYGMQWGRFIADEGSGISSAAHVTPREIVRLLKAFLEVDGGQLVVQSIPRSGIEGTMSKTLAEPEYRGRVRGKIGHVYQGYCLSGYVLDEKDKKPVMIYSIMANAMPPGKETEAKPLHNNICKLLVDYVDGRANSN